MKERDRRRLSAIALVCLGACGAPTDVEAPPPDFADAPSLSLTSASGRLSAGLRASPARPTTGINAFELRLVDASGAPLDGATLAVAPWMPAHGHGASTVPAVVARGGGVYEIDRVVFYMPGRWELRVDVSATPGAVGERIVAPFDVR